MQETATPHLYDIEPEDMSILADGSRMLLVQPGLECSVISNGELLRPGQMCFSDGSTGFILDGNGSYQLAVHQPEQGMIGPNVNMNSWSVPFIMDMLRTRISPTTITPRKNPQSQNDYYPLEPDPAIIKIYAAGYTIYEKPSGEKEGTHYLPSANKPLQKIGVVLQTERTESMDILRPETPLAVQMEIIRHPNAEQTSTVFRLKSNVDGYSEIGIEPALEEIPYLFGRAGDKCLVWTDLPGGYGREARYYLDWDLSGDFETIRPYFEYGIYFRCRIAWEKHDVTEAMIWRQWSNELPLSLNHPPTPPTELNMSARS